MSQPDFSKAHALLTNASQEMDGHVGRFAAEINYTLGGHATSATGDWRLQKTNAHETLERSLG
jgi:hypothetical protein